MRAVRASSSADFSSEECSSADFSSAGCSNEQCSRDGLSHREWSEEEHLEHTAEAGDVTHEGAPSGSQVYHAHSADEHNRGDAGSLGGMASNSHDRDVAAEVKAEAEVTDDSSEGDSQSDGEDNQDKFLDAIQEYERDHL